MRGKFITFEGGEGTGKSTQITRLAERFENQGKEVVVTREPGGTPGAEAVRHILLSGAAEKIGSDMEAILFAGARADHVDHIIRPALKQGKIVLCDRFIDSTRAYQGASGKVSMERLRALEQAVCGDVWPDLTLILDLEVENSISRADVRRGSAKADRFEKDNESEQEARRQAFLEIAKNAPERCEVIKASGTIEEISQNIWNVVNKRLFSVVENPIDEATLKRKIIKLKPKKRRQYYE